MTFQAGKRLIDHPVAELARPFAGPPQSGTHEGKPVPAAPRFASATFGERRGAIGGLRFRRVESPVTRRRGDSMAWRVHPSPLLARLPC
jgi:hypothetical protein